ncbi:TetR/AcrR family transcriptional regulator [Breoghania sp.]|uniref:TetR/AcrR family transcriptional regulator n=1 Tax=Breoghania sp. TaxID=2065378 RepID=UPI002AA6BACC|nr:TetR/AcrR family transcriptional regulator [Breoghania sp.]
METNTPHTVDPQDVSARSAGPGRPREFDEAEVLAAALELFWEHGFEATSVDALTAAMGLSRSSFYAAFGSKQGVLLAALRYYSDDAYRGWAELVSGTCAEGAKAGALALVNALSRPECGPRGCLLANMITERGPHDRQVAELGRRHFARIESLFARCLDPEHPERVRDRARALMALAFGAMVLRKSGLPCEDVERILDQANDLIGA